MRAASTVVAVMLRAAQAAHAQQPSSVGRTAPKLENEVVCLVEPSLETNVGTPVDGVLEVVKADRGDLVQPGQLLAQLASGVEMASIDRQAAKADYLGRKLARNKDMDRRQMIAPQELDEIATEHALAELELRERREQLKQRSLLSPVRGVVVERYRHLGELVKQERIFRIAQLDPLHVETIVPSQYFGRIKAGQVYEVKPQFSAAPLKARVSTVDRTIDAASGTFRVRLLLPNPNLDIPAGQRCRVNF
jgi:membrane fusion protein, multidrug efflux system